MNEPNTWIMLGLLTSVAIGVIGTVYGILKNYKRRKIKSSHSAILLIFVSICLIAVFNIHPPYNALVWLPFGIFMILWSTKVSKTPESDPVDGDQ